MAAKTCEECGVGLTARNSNLIGRKCVECQKMPYSNSKAYFARSPTSEDTIKDWPLMPSTRRFILLGAILYVAIILGSMVGYAAGGPFRALFYALLAATACGVVFRLWVTSQSAHPLEASRWASFGLPFLMITFFGWAIAYMGLMPSFMAPSRIFSIRTLITPSWAVPTFLVVAFWGLIAAVIGMGVGTFFLKRGDIKNKDRLITQFKRWQGENS